MARKPWEPKAGGAGSTVTWRHFHHGGQTSEVTGEVVCEAPSVQGCRTVWVVPTTPGFTEVYSMVPVVKVSRERFRFTTGSGRFRMVTSGSASKGEYVSSGVAGTQTAEMMMVAWRHGQHVKEAATVAAEQEAVAA